MLNYYIFSERSAAMAGAAQMKPARSARSGEYKTPRDFSSTDSTAPRHSSALQLFNYTFLRTATISTPRQARWLEYKLKTRPNAMATTLSASRIRHVGRGDQNGRVRPPPTLLISRLRSKRRAMLPPMERRRKDWLAPAAQNVMPLKTPRKVGSLWNVIFRC